MRNFSIFFLSLLFFLAFPLTFQGQTLSADNDGDGCVTTSDLMILLSQFGECSQSLSADLDGDGCVTSSDLMTFLSQFGECSFANTFSGITVFSVADGPQMCALDNIFAYLYLVFEGCDTSSTLISNPVDGNLLTFTLGDFVLESFECWESDLGDYRQYTGGQAFLHDGETLIATFQDVSFEADVDYSNTMEGGGTAVLVEEGTDPVYFAEYGNQVTFTFVGSNPVVQADCGTYETVIVINPFICDDLDENGICDEFEAAPCGDLISHDGHEYSTVLIGDQCWFSENCRYLPEVFPSSAYSTTDPYYYVYDFNGSDVAAAKATANYDTYGVLYNWPAVMTAGICPSGWHIPTDEEFTELTDFLGGEGVAGGKMKEAGYDHWNSPNTGATNSSEFNGLPGGSPFSGSFFYNGSYGFWWSASESGSYSWVRELDAGSDSVLRDYFYRDAGFSARCVRD